MSEAKSNEDLAQEFIFFMKKIENIRNSLNAFNKFTPAINKNILKMDSFRDLSDNDVKKLILSMPTKSCELDSLPTKFLKDNLDTLLPSITKIINLSLGTGKFVKKIGKLQSYDPF